MRPFHSRRGRILPKRLGCSGRLLLLFSFTYIKIMFIFKCSGFRFCSQLFTYSPNFLWLDAVMYWTSSYHSLIAVFQSDLVKAAVDIVM